MSEEPIQQRISTRLDGRVALVTGAARGLGRVISDAYSDFNNPRMYALMLLLIIVATVVNMVLHAFDQRWAERRGIGRP